MMSHTKCAGVMIGRAALSQPWIFRDTWSYLTTGEIPESPTIQQKCQLMCDHFHNMIRYRSEHAAVVRIPQARKLVRKADEPMQAPSRRDTDDQLGGRV